VAAAWQLKLGELGGLAERKTLERLANRWAENNLDEAMNWLSEQPADESGRRDHLAKGIAAVRSQESPSEAARLIAEQMSPNFLQFDAAMNLVSLWAARDYFGAASWVERFPEGPVRERGREELLKGLSASPVS